MRVHKSKGNQHKGIIRARYSPLRPNHIKLEPTAIRTYNFLGGASANHFPHKTFEVTHRIRRGMEGSGRDYWDGRFWTGLGFMARLEWRGKVLSLDADDILNKT
jgi:hypothetical protein